MWSMMPNFSIVSPIASMPTASARRAVTVFSDSVSATLSGVGPRNLLLL